MPKLKQSLTVNHTAENLYELVKDIRSYPSFIKWIQNLRVSDERQDGDLYKCLGSADVGFRGFFETFATHVVGNPQTLQIDVSLASGPFRHLRNQWRFSDIEAGKSRIDFFIDYEFRNPILRLLAKSNTQIAVDRIMAAFIDEANRRYGRR